MDKITRILNKINNKNKLKEAELKTAENDYNLIEKNRKINKLKMAVKEDKKIKINGIALFLFAIFATIATTWTSISGGMEDFIEAAIPFALIMIGIQSGLFLITLNETTLKYKFPDGFWIIKLLQIGLLSSSINFNYQFFTKYRADKSFSLWTLIVCIIFDVLILTSIARSSDFMRLNYHKPKSKDVDFDNMGLLKMALFNITSKFRINTIRSFNYNRAQFKKAIKDTDIYIDDNTVLKKDSEDLKNDDLSYKRITEKNKPAKLLQYSDYTNKNNKNVDDDKPVEQENNNYTVLKKDIDILLKAILENKDQNNICPSITKLEEMTNLSRPAITKGKKHLVDEGILTTKGFSTIVNIDNMDKLN
jgi:hypothetical protein